MFSLPPPSGRRRLRDVRGDARLDQVHAEAVRLRGRGAAVAEPPRQRPAGGVAGL